MMILIVGGTGRLGSELVRRFTERGLPVRVLTRNPSRADLLRSELVEVVSGDIHDRATLERAVAGASTVISAMHGFVGTGGDSPRTVDYEGNRDLIAAARANRVDHVILMSVHRAAPDHPMELHRMKYLAEVEIKGSGLAWTIIRPTAFMETWLDVIGEPLVQTGKTRVFGRGSNPINFIAVNDVADVVECAVVDPSLRGVELDLGGPENLTMRQLAETVLTVTEKAGSISSVPLPLMRLMAVLLRPVNRTLARQIQAGVVMDTYDMSFTRADAAPAVAPIPSLHLADVVRRNHAHDGKANSTQPRGT